MALLYKCVYYYYYFGGDFDVFDDGDSEKLSDNNDVLMTREMESGAVSISLHQSINVSCGTVSNRLRDESATYFRI